MFMYCPRLSVLSWVHFWLERGVVNWLWFLSEASYCPGVLCKGFQGVLLQSSGGVLVVDCPSFVLEGSKVGGMSRQKSPKIWPSEVDRGVVNL